MSDAAMSQGKQATAPNVCLLAGSMTAASQSMASLGPIRADLRERQAGAAGVDQRIHNYCWGAGVPWEGSAHSRHRSIDSTLTLSCTNDTADWCMGWKKYIFIYMWEED